MKNRAKIYDPAEAHHLVMKVSVVSIVVNILLSVMKLLAGIIARSGAMISDAVHSASDVFSTIIVIIGINLSSRKSDTEHQYGHERMECVAAMVLAVVLAATGLGIGYTGVVKILSFSAEGIEIPGRLALAAAVISIIVKEWMYWYTRRGAERINSGALMADAWHHRSDSLSSAGAFLGILGARLGYPVLDPLASIIICMLIAKAAYDIFRDAMDKMVDKSAPDEVVADMRLVIAQQKGVAGIDEIKTRLFGAKVYVDVEIAADGSQPLTESHQIAERVHHAVEENFPQVKHCMVHVNPLPPSEKTKRR